MKRVFYLLIILPVFMVSCELIPEAGFFVDKTDPEVGEDVFFTNDSFNATRYEWDFGDGTSSDAVNPVHSFTGTGTYQVKLTAYSRTGLSDEAFQTISVLIPTLLEIEVLEYTNLYPVEDASVILYPTLSDWDAERNMVAEGFTNQEGKVVFTGLGAFVFYLDIWEQNHNNYALRDEDVGFIRTPQLKLHQINRFTAYVDYTGGKGVGSPVRDRKMIIKRLVPRVFQE